MGSCSIQMACLIKNLNRMELQMENSINALRNLSPVSSSFCVESIVECAVASTV